MCDFEGWALERARRYLGVGVVENTLAGEAEPYDVQIQAREAEMDDESAAVVQTFPLSQDATVMLILSIKEFVLTEPMPDHLSATSKTSESHRPEADDEAADAVNSKDEERDVAKPEGELATEASYAVNTGTEEDEAATPIAGPLDPQQQEEGGEAATDELDQTGEKEGTGVLEQHISGMQGKSESKSPVLPVKVEVHRLQAQFVPSAKAAADEGIPAVYFVKRANSKPTASFEEQYHVGVMPVASIMKMSQMISQAYVPAIQRSNSAQDTDNQGRMLGSETVSTITKLSGSLSNAVVSLRGNVSMELPGVNLERTPEMLRIDDRAMEILRASLQDWTSTVRTMLQETKQRKPKSQSAMAEVDFWRDCYMSLDGVCERLQTSRQFAMSLAMMRACLPNESTEFEHHFKELTKLHIEAQDNVKFLSTLERHLKMMGTASLGSITDCLPSLFNGLRMVWVLSRHYNTDERMSGLMKRIGDEISDRVVAGVDIAALFGQCSPRGVVARVSVAKTLLVAWKNTYKKTREKIEKTGQEPEDEADKGISDKSTRQVSDRWEFPEKVLFGRTDFIASKLENLEQVASTVEQLQDFFGPQLKKVIGNATAIDIMFERVTSMLQPFARIDFDVFDHESSKATENKILWDGLIGAFDMTVNAIDIETNELIQASFAELRSTEAALQLLQHFKTINCRKSISDVVNGKLGEILKQFTTEVEVVREMWEVSKDNPPLPKNQPPVCGAIMWSRSLFFRIKKTILKFQTYCPLEDTEDGKLTIRKYIDLGKALRNYENEQHAGWLRTSEQEAVDLLKMPVLRLDEADGEINVNFPDALLQLMREAKSLDKMGFSVGNTVLNIALREQQYIMLHESLKHMIANYRHTLDDLDPSLRGLCSKKIASLKASMSLGFTALNWVSLGTHDFIEKTNKELSAFHGFVRLMDNNAAKINEIVGKIQSAALVPSEQQLFGVEKDGLDLTEVYSRIEAHRAGVVESLIEQHEQIMPLLCKIEEVAVNANTGRSKMMVSYYRYWEQRVFHALVTAILEGMRSLAVLLCVESFRPDGDKGRPLMRVLARADPAIVTSPTLAEVSKIIEKLLTGIVERTSRRFVRWMAGTCKPCPLQEVSGQDEPVAISMYEDVSAHPSCIKLMLSIRTSLPNTVMRIEKSHKRFARHASLWDDDRQMIVERWVKGKGRTGVEFDERLKFYSNVVRDLSLFPRTVTVAFCRISYEQVLAGIKEEAQKWTTIYSKFLHDDASAKLIRMQERIRDIRADMEKTPETKEEFRYLLQVIHDARESSLEVEGVAIDVEERFSILEFYKFDLGERELQDSQMLLSEWYKLVAEAVERSYDVGKLKKEFAGQTKQESEEFLTETDDFFKAIAAEGPGSPELELDVAAELAVTFSAELKKLQQRKDDIVLSMKLFDLEPVVFGSLAQATDKMKCIIEIMTLYGEFSEACKSWSSALFFSELSVDALTSGAGNFKAKFKKLPEYTHKYQLFDKLGATITSFQNSLPLLGLLKSDAMRTRHWKKLLPSVEVNPQTFTLAQLFALNLADIADFVEEVVTEATKEVQIEKGIAEVENNWNTCELVLYKYERDGYDRGQCLRASEDITIMLDDDLMNLSSMAASKFIGPFATDVQTWSQRLDHIGETLDAWMTVQKKWQYLESIFIGSEDIKQQLPDAAKRFDVIDKTWHKTMLETAKEKSVVKACCMEGRLEMFNELASNLDKCQKSLSDFLDSKRNTFPRFFFISDDEMLQILGSSDVTAVQEHCLKMFDNCATLIFKRQNKVVAGMISSEGESFDFRTQTPTDGPVEFWMGDVVKEMQASLRVIMKEGIFHYPKMARLKWIDDNIGMTVNGASKLWWTWQVEDGFKKVQQGQKYAIKDLLGMLSKQLNELVYETRNKLASSQRKKINTLIIIDVHARDIIDTFVRDSILDEREFAWESQLRFYWLRVEDNLYARQCTFKTPFGYEYMGLNGRLVITPLTDRCYMTLTQALSFRLGGAPAGPAGTGKTETTKDLAKAMSLYCVVFNCGDGLDYKAMASIFSGLVQVGAWGCFDEFNRIEAPVLSVVAAQLKTLQSAFVAGVKTCFFEGRDINVVDSCGFFITMNPGYAGRTELPDNLKALFRPMTMITPDLSIICENMLLSEGFGQARVLAKKMVTLYQLAKEQLSKQYHYDWGLRALKSVLVMAGSLKRASLDLPEDVVLMRALRDMNSPKFVFEDVPLFLGLLADLFPGLKCPRVGYPDFNRSVTEVLKSGDFVLIDWQMDKIVQLYETMMTRHTTMVVGPTGGGKSVVLNSLCATQTAMGLPTKITVINPKMIPVSELYGELDPITRDWTDGLLSNIFREMNKPLPEGKNERRYICYDGDVDALWVENMNSVMDDNKLLTLPNGERIRLQAFAAMLFEVGDLQYASPATVSRCGMVWVDPKNLEFRPFFQRWLVTTFRAGEGALGENPERVARLEELFSKYVPSLVDWFMLGLIFGGYEVKPRMVLPLTNLNLVVSLTYLLTSCFQQAPETEAKHVEAIFCACLTWSFGAALIQSEQKRFDANLKKLSGMTASDAASVQGTSLPGQSKFTIFDYKYQLEDKQWVQWSTQVADFSPKPGCAFYEILVPTADTVRSTWLVETCVEVFRPSIFVGDSGTSKTVTLQHYLKGLDVDKFNLLNIGFSSRTSGKDLQLNIESNVEKRLKGTYGPPGGKKLIIFIDDINMPIVDTYGTQQPVTLLKLFIERGGLYDREELTWKNIISTHCMAACGPPGGARNPMDPRFVSLFNIFNIPFPADESLNRIFATILDHHFEPFSSLAKDGAFFQGCGKTFSQCTLKLYQSVVSSMPPTPKRFHYLFNLRDLSRICEGLCTSMPDTMPSPVTVCRLWRNEVLRVFHDRLISQEDKDWFMKAANAQLQASFPGQSDALEGEVVFGDFRNALAVMEGASEARLNEDLGTYSNAKQLWDAILESYNEKEKAMDLVLFDDAIEHLCRLHRLLRLPRGNALLVGVGGSGKQSLTRLAAFAAQCLMFQITITRTYGVNEFREDLKVMYGMLKKQPVVFLLTDQHIADEGFLELINNLLTMGMVPALFADDERVGLINSVAKEVKEKGFPASKDAMWSYYVDKCRDNLHIVLAMSPVGDDLRRRCRNFPGMVNNAVIDWFQPWPADALHLVADKFLAEIELEDEHRSNVTNHMIFVHKSVLDASVDYATVQRRYNYVTPKNYLTFISAYKHQLATNRSQNEELVERLNGGLKKLIQAGKDVAIMQKELAEKTVIVDQKTKDCGEMLETIATNTTEATEKQEAAAIQEEELAVESKNIAEQKAVAEEKLGAAMPALEEAAEALKALEKKDIDEIKSFAKPHVLVQSVAECVGILKRQKDTSWAGAKAMMSQGNFLRSLMEFEKDSITDKQVGQIKKYMSDSQFNPTSLMKISTAGAGLLKWVFAMVNYYAVAREINPMREAVKKAEMQLNSAQKGLARVKKELVELADMLEKLKEDLAKSTQEKNELKEQADTMERQLVAAEKLINGLSSEQTRWKSDIERLQRNRVMLVGDCLITSSFLSYLGAFNFDFRQMLIVDKWQVDLTERKVPKNDPIDLQVLLTNEVEVIKWASEGLPSDELSVQNGILCSQSSSFPLCIDPQMQAVTWIKRKEGKELAGRVKTFNDSDFLKHLEMSVNFGFPFLFENLDEYLDPVVNPVLEKNLTVQGSRKFVKLGDKEVDWDPTFRMYLTTKLSNPHYAPEIFGKTSIINFAVTEDGLRDQLLNVVVGFERPDLEAQRLELVDDVSKNKAQQKQLENTLLRELAGASGNILDNTELIATLESCKTAAVEIEAKLELAKVTTEDINVARAKYLPAAKRGSILFFSISGLSSLNPMYETSLSSFLGVFTKALDRAKRDMNLQTRIDNIIKTLTQLFYDFMCYGLFEKHKLMFSFNMCIRILSGDGDVNAQLLDFFLRGNTSLGEPEISKPNIWMSDQGWKDILQLTKVAETSSPLKALATDVEKKEDEWFQWYALEAPETGMMPKGYHDLHPFEQMCLIKCFRPDRVQHCVTLFVMKKIGEGYVEPPSLNYEHVLKMSSPTTPVVFVLSPGADPAYSIFELAEVEGMAPPKLKYVSLGQGQGPIAVSLLETGAARGLWVLLQNCHLLPKWLKTLEKTLEKLQDKPHKDFRLWLTTDPIDTFPLGILQQSFKVVTEPPNGLKLNLRSTWSKLTDEALGKSPNEAFKPVIYVLAFLHAVVQERRKFGKLGWNVPYDFNESDFRICFSLLELYLTKQIENGDEDKPWNTLRYLVGEVHYGGRVTDHYDRRILNTYMQEYFGDFLFDSMQKFSFYKDERVEYGTPDLLASCSDYADFIESLPLLTGPEVFGLHSNAEIDYLNTASTELLMNLIELQPRTAALGGGMTREETVNVVAEDIIAKIPSLFDMPRLRVMIPIPQPTQVVLLQELDHWNKLLRTMSSALKTLLRALKGEVGMSAILEDLATALFNGVLPSSWVKLTPQTEKTLGVWMDNFLRRQDQYASWAQEGREPKVMWLSGLQIPATYLAAIVQTTCRAKKWALDKSTLMTKVTTMTSADEINAMPEFGCYLIGLFLHGASWDNHASRLMKQLPKTLVEPLPILQVVPVERHRLKLQGMLPTPVYVTAQRRNAMGVGLVFEANLDSVHHNSHWILQGVALTLE